LKKIQGSYYYTERIVSLYRDDLEEMIDVLRASASGVVISDDKYEYDSLDELETEKGTMLDEINIKTPLPMKLEAKGMSFVILELKKEALIFAGGPESEIPFLKLKEIIQSKRSWLYKIFNPWVWGSAACLFASLLAYLHFVKTLPYAIGLLILVPVIVGFVISLLERSNIFFSINLSKRHAVSTFWSRNKDKIILILVTSAISATLGAWLHVLIGRFLQRP
jgi:hypothetical protein